MRRGDSIPAPVDDAQSLGSREFGPSQNGKQVGRGILAGQQAANRGLDHRALAQAAVAADRGKHGRASVARSGPGQKLVQRVDPFRVVLGASERQFAANDAAGRRAHAGIGVGERGEQVSLDRRAAGPLRHLEEAAKLDGLAPRLGGKLGGKERAERPLEQLEGRLVEEAELAVVADVDHVLGLAGVEAALEERSVKCLEHRAALGLVAALQSGQNRVQKHVALDGLAGLDDRRPELFGQLGDILLEADTAAQVLVEHDVQPLAQVLPDDGNVWLGHPGQVGVDDPPLEGNVAAAVEPLPQAAQGLQAGPEVGVAGQLDQALGQVKPDCPCPGTGRRRSVSHPGARADPDRPEPS